MVYTNVTETSSYPTEVLRLNFSEPAISILSNTWVRFSRLSRRLGTREQYLYEPSLPTIPYGTSFDKNEFLFPPVTALDWNVSDHTDNFLSFYSKDTDDPYINIVPTRIIPSLSSTDLYNLSGTVRSSEWYVLTSDESIEDNRIETLYLSGVKSTSALPIEFGNYHLKKRISNSQFYQFGTPTNFVNGTFPHSINYIFMYTTAIIDGDEVRLKLVPSLVNPSELYSIPQDTTTNYCDTSAVTGTIDYDTGDWSLTYNCGQSKQDSYIETTYIKHEETVPITITSSTSATPNFSLTTDIPFYLYDIDVEVSGIYGFSLSFDASSVINNNYSSEVSLYPKMKDLYGQLSLDLDGNYSNWRFTSLVTYDGLSAIKNSGQVYTQGEWLSGDDVPIKFSSEDDFYGKFLGTLEISSTNGEILDYNVEIYSNSANAELILSATNVEGDEAELAIISDLDIDGSSGIYFDFYPKNQNTQLVNCNGTVLATNTSYLYNNVSCLSVINLGLGTTTISLTSDQYNLVGAVGVTSDLVLSDFELKVYAEDVAGDCSNLLSNHTISTYFEKDGVKYIPPIDGSICWEINSTGSYELSARNRQSDFIFLDSCVPSIYNDLLDFNLDLGEDTIAKGDELDIGVKYKTLQGEVIYSTNSAFIHAQNVPDSDVYGSFFGVYEGLEKLATSKTTNNYPLVSGSYNFTFTLDDLPFQYTSSNVKWNIDGIDSTGYTVSQTLSSDTFDTKTAYVSVYGVGLGGWNRQFCFTDSIQFNFVGSNSVDFLVFPKNRYGGQTRTIQDFSNYSSSYGNTAYNCGHSETFYLSAEGGYDSYTWEIGNSTITTTDNTTTLKIKGNPNMIGDNQTVYVSAFDYDTSTNIPFVGFSDNSTPFKSHVRFLNYFGYSNDTSIDKDVFEITNRNNRLEPFNISLDFSQLTASPVSIVKGGTGHISLSTTNGETYYSVNVDANNVNLFNNFSLNKEDFFRIKPNTFNVMNICTSATLNLRIKDNTDYNIKEFETDLVCIPITAYNGPFLSISTESNCVSSQSTVNFKNITPSFLGLTYSDFTFDDGNGNIMTTTTTTEPLTGYYDIAGTYSPILSGTLNGDLIIRRFNNFIIADCDSGCESYNSNIDRRFPDELEFPNKKETILIKPNERLTYLNFNNSIDKIKENFEYLKDKSKAYALDVPTTVVDSIFLEDLALDVKSWKMVDNIFFYITNEGNVKIIDTTNMKDATLEPEDRITVIKDDNIITEGEQFINPINIDVSSDGSFYTVIDEKSIYVFDFIDNKSKLKTYWGGSGSRSARTKFNNPIEVIIDEDGSLYVVDRASFIIKKYNKYFNWISNVEHPDFLKDRVLLESISVDQYNNLYVLGSNKHIYTFNQSGTFLKKFQISESNSKIFVNTSYDGIIYIINGNKIITYTIDGVRINQWLAPKFTENVIGIQQDGTLLNILTENNFYVVFDCLKVENLRDETLDSEFWEFDDLKINKDEFVQDWVYNDVFQKIAQNIDMFKRSIIYKFLTYIDPFNPERIVYSKAVLDDVDISTCEIDNNFIGINELVSYEVINRQLIKIYECMEDLLDMIKSKTNSAAECSDVCFTWKKLTTNNRLQNNTCSNNPISWSELGNYNVSEWSSLSCVSSSATELELINWTLSASNNRVPNSIDNCDITNK